MSKPYNPKRPVSTGSRSLPQGVDNGTYALRPHASGTLEIDIREFIGWWETEQANFVRRVKEAAPDLIKLSIASGGGYVSDALAIHDFLKAYPARVEVEITGTTASAATIIAMCGDRVGMSDNALFLAHYSRMGIWAWGPADLLEKAADEAVRSLRKHDQVILKIYAKKTGQPDDDLDELLQLEEWLTAEETLDWGFIDEVFEPEVEEGEEAAAANMGGVAYAPPASVIKALGLPRLPRKGHRPTDGENFAAWSNRLIDAVDEDEDDERTRADVLDELAEAVGLSVGIVRAIVSEEDPIDCPFTNAEKFPTPSERRDAVRAWAGVLDASPRDAFAALEADGCTYEDEDADARSAEEGADNRRAARRGHSRFASRNTSGRNTSARHPTDTTMTVEERLAQMEAELAAQKAANEEQQAEIQQQKAANERLAKEKRAAALAALRQALTGKVPGVAVEALVELAEVADQAAAGSAQTFKATVGSQSEQVETGLIERLAAIAETIPSMVRTLPLDTTPSGDGASAEAELLHEAGQAL